MNIFRRIGKALHEWSGCYYNRAPLSRGRDNRYEPKCVVCGKPAPDDIMELVELDNHHYDK